MTVAKKSILIAISIGLCVIVVVAACTVALLHRSSDNGKAYASSIFMYDIYDDALNVAAADNVFAGEVLEIASNSFVCEGSIPYRTYKVRVLTSLKGSFERELLVEVGEMGGYTKDGKELIMEGHDVAPLTIGASYIFCTRNEENGTPGIGSDPSVVLLENDFDPAAPENSKIYSHFIDALAEKKSLEIDWERYTSIYDRKDS